MNILQKLEISEFIFSAYPRITLPGNKNRSSPKTQTVVKHHHKRLSVVIILLWVYYCWW